MNKKILKIIIITFILTISINVKAEDNISGTFNITSNFTIDSFQFASLIYGTFNPSAINDGILGMNQNNTNIISLLKDNSVITQNIFSLYDPETSIRFGAYYISKCMQRYDNSMDTAAAAYHSGWGTVDKLLEDKEGRFLTEFPFVQMNNYVVKINKAYNFYYKIYENREGV